MARIRTRGRVSDRGLPLETRALTLVPPLQLAAVGTDNATGGRGGPGSACVCVGEIRAPTGLPDVGILLSVLMFLPMCYVPPFVTYAASVIVLVFLVLGGAFAAWFLMLSRVERLVTSAPERLACLACPRCEAVVGVDAAAEVRARREEDMRRLRERAGNVMLRLRIDPFWRFPCPACGVELKFDPGTKRDPLTVSKDDRRATQQ